ncbi:hypothetical protein [Methylococcus mesophilus]|uniref:hypothetical protein n=1 Tax=Methylococcus mesophilus TaxID=2993564 RepID=UPI00224B330D|nr:hypothetical protein [Methylococcus mesophilus]UZR27134.1 hypothetical protein OOT43_10310 [Methylococcus mesophilus]
MAMDLAKNNFPKLTAVVPAWIAGTQVPGMEWLGNIHVSWMPAILAGMTVL